MFSIIDARRSFAVLRFCGAAANRILAISKASAAFGLRYARSSASLHNTAR
jgi:hypothetical protein